MNTWKRKALTVLSVPLLAVPSAIGVYSYLAPESGEIGAGLAAAGFEVLYVGVNILIISTPELRHYARNVSLAAVVVAVLMNSLAHYGAKVPGAYTGASFDGLAAVLALVASAPLAGLAYAVSVLLHRLSDDEGEKTPALRTAIASEIAGEAVYATVNTDGLPSNSSNTPTRDYTCRHCGAEGLTKAEQLAHGRRRARSGTCALEARIDNAGQISYVEPRAVLHER